MPPGLIRRDCPAQRLGRFAKASDERAAHAFRIYEAHGSSDSLNWLDAGIPVHTVAQRIGDDPAMVLRNYAKRKRTKKADESLSNAITALAAGFLKS